MTIPTAYKRLSDARSTLGAPVGLGGGLADEALRRFFRLSWTGTHRLQDRALGFEHIYHFSTSYQATMAGRAYGGHGKPAVGRSEGAPSADRATIPPQWDTGGNQRG